MSIRREVLDFLLDHRGWIKKSPKDLHRRLYNLGIDVSMDDIRAYQAEARVIIKEPSTEEYSDNEDNITDRMRVKKVWITPEGKKGVSYEVSPKEESESSIIETIERIVKEGITPYAPKVSERSTNEKMLSVFTSDKHIGAHTPLNSIYSNRYDKEEIYERHEKLIDHITKQKKVFGKFRTFCFFDLGDALDGSDSSTVRGGHYLPQNMDDREQLDTLIEVTIMTLEALIKADIADDFWFIATSNDNHAGSFGHGALRAIQMYIQAKYPFVKTLITGKPLEHITFGNHTYIFGHGKDDADMRSGLPLNLNEKTENFINDYIDRKKLSSKYVHVQKGDLHQSSTNYGKRFRYCNNMSMYGSSKWIHSNFGSGKAGVDYEIAELYGSDIYRSRLIYGHDS